jgi:hypothetical protein
MSWARTVDGSGGFSETITPTEGAANVITAKPASSGGGGYSYSPVAITTTTSTVTTTSVTSTWEKLIGKVIINELYPNPPGSDTNDEFIELKNISESDIDLTGLVLADASKNKFLIKASSSATSTNMIPAGGFKVFKRTQTDLALNNTGVESVFLKTADLQVIDQVDYVGENEEGVSYSRADDGKWRWVKTPTPGEDNASDELYPDRENQAVLDDSAVADIKLVATVKSTAKGKATVNTTLEELKNYSSGDRVRVQGIVSVAPGVLGSQYFYLAGSGVQVYCYKKDFSELKIGDLIEVVGEISDTATVGRRIKITNRNDIKFISHQDAPQPHAITSADLEEYEGSLIKISGTVLDIKSRNITIDDGNDEIKVYVNNQIEFKDIDVKEGDQLTITGIVGRISSGWRIMPRDLSDFQVETGQVQGAYATSSSVNFNSLSWYLGAIIAFLSGLVAILWFRLRKNKRHNV